MNDPGPSVNLNSDVDVDIHENPTLGLGTLHAGRSTARPPKRIVIVPDEPAPGPSTGLSPGIRQMGK